LNKIKEKKPLK